MSLCAPLLFPCSRARDVPPAACAVSADPREKSLFVRVPIPGSRRRPNQRPDTYCPRLSTQFFFLLLSILSIPRFRCAAPSPSVLHHVGGRRLWKRSIRAHL